MKKLIAVLMFSVTALLAACGQSDDPAQASAETKIIVGLDDNFPPMGFRDDSNQLVGFDIDWRVKPPNAPASTLNSSP